MHIVRVIKACVGINPFKAFRTLMEMLSFRLTWTRHDSDSVPPGLSQKFVSAWQAVGMIPDGATVIIGGFTSIGRSSIFYWAMREAYERSGHPRDLTIIGSNPQGGRGKVPGTIEELGLPGLISRYIVGHGETAKALLELAERGDLELHTMPQGELAFLIEGQGRGEYTLGTTIGTGTFLDPRVGTGSAVTPHARSNFIQARGDELVYSLPPIDRALFLAPAADEEGNIYFRNAALILENREAAAAAKRNRGCVIVSVAEIVPKSPSEISIPAGMVDAIVVNPRNEQIGGVLQIKCWPFFAGQGHMETEEAARLLKLVNTFMGITPYRGEASEAVARMAARLFVQETRPGAVVNIGIGMGEEVARILHESGLSLDVTFTTEGGALGGLPAAGIYFGSAINPERILSTAEMFRLYRERLDTTVLGFLQVDSDGNVNVSHRGRSMTDFVGPGGFTDLVTYARTIIFVGSWMDKAEFAVSGGRVRIKKPGRPKFVDRVDYVTFNGSEALKAGKRVYYVTTAGIFKLTGRGLELIRIMPGLDIERDILATSTARLVIPDGPVPAVPPEIVSGKGFSLRRTD
jgi:propionate CoA-transferase